MGHNLDFTDDTTPFENDLDRWAGTIIPGPGEVVVGGPSGPAKAPGQFNARAYSTPPTTATQAGLVAAIADAKSAVSPFNAKGVVVLPPGDLTITSTVDMTDQNALGLIGSGPDSSRIVWGGASGGTMLRIQGIRRGRFAEFALVGPSDQSTTAVTYDGTPSGIVSTEGIFDHLWLYRHRYGFRIGGLTHYQADQTQFNRLVFKQVRDVAASIEDANAVVHNFYDCLFDQCGKGISAGHFLGSGGTGGSFNAYGCGFLNCTDWELEVFPSSRGTTIDGCWSERGTRHLAITSGSTACSVSMIEFSVNGVRYSERVTPPGSGTYTLTYKAQTTGNLNWNDSIATVQAALQALSTVGAGNMTVAPALDGASGYMVQRTGTLEFDTAALTGSAGVTVAKVDYHMNLGASGSVNLIGGKYLTLQGGASPYRIRIGGNNQRRTNINVVGTTFDGDPFASSTNMQYASVHLTGVQHRNVMDATVPGQTDGPLAYGSAAAPRLLSEQFYWSPAVWLKIPSGTALSAGVNTFTGNSWQVHGLTTITVDSVFKVGGLVQPFSIYAQDDNASVTNQFKVNVLVGSGFTLTSDLVFRLTFQPEFAHQ